MEQSLPGNLWATNSWEPSASVDILRAYPGGDGVLIFLGGAAPVLRS